jgi:hypothetical protein
MGSADFVLPVPDLEGSGNADAADARDLARLKISRDNVEPFLEQANGMLRSVG